MKEAASHQMERVTNTTFALQNGFKESIKSYKNEVGCFARSLAEIVDGEEILKTIHKAVKPDDYKNRQLKVIHTPIDWSKHPPSSHKRFLDGYSQEVGKDENGDAGKDIDSDLILKSQKSSTDHYQAAKPPARRKTITKYFTAVCKVCRQFSSQIKLCKASRQVQKCRSWSI